VPLSQLEDFVPDACGDLTILALQLSQPQELARGVGRVEGDVFADGFDVLLNIPELLCQEDSESFVGVYAHTAPALIFISSSHLSGTLRNT
jgi:hypothetical protein